MAFGLALTSNLFFQSAAQTEPVLDRPALHEVSLEPGGVFQFSVQGASDLAYWIARSADLQSWATLDFTNSSSGHFRIQMPASAERQFFRAGAALASVASATNYHRWADSLVLSNGRVEAVIVPAIGRVMQFRFLGENSGPFWENRTQDGRLPNPNSTTWANFGGDKVWPAPQGDWPRITGRSWPPPAAFDSMSVTANVERGMVLLTSPVDPKYGIRTIRRLELHPTDPVLRIVNTFDKQAAGTAATSNRVSIWTVTQLAHPERIFVPVPDTSIYPRGYNLQSAALPASFAATNGLISFTRDKAASHKIGSDAGTLLWVGPTASLRMDAPRLAHLGKADYPDNGSSVEVYTNPDPDAYVELEMLGPLETLRVGEQMTHTVTYTLIPRTETSAEDEARKILQGP